MAFGKHKGTPMKEVPAKYLDWFMDQTWKDSWPNLVAYCQKNEKYIAEELSEGEYE